MLASRAIETGDADVVLVGGVESMSRAPWVMLKPEKGFPAGPQTLHSTTLGWRMVNPEMPDAWTISLGESTEKLAGIHGVGREAQDAFALRSHQLRRRGLERAASTTLGRPGAGRDFARDEGIRADSSLEKLAKLKPAFVKDGTVTAGNASPLNDGASAVLIASEAERGRPRAARADRRPRHVRRGPRHLRHRPGRGRQPGARSAPGSTGTRSTRSSSTRRSPRSRWPASASGRSTRSA